MNREQDRAQLQAVVKALERIPLTIRQQIYQMSQGTPRASLVASFNQLSRDMFTLLEQITKECGRFETTKLGSNRALFDAAIKAHSEIALNKFTLLVLEFAPEIYSRDEQAFLAMTIPTTEVNTSAGWGVIRSEEFRSMWTDEMTRAMKDAVTELMTKMVTVAHAYLYQTMEG